MKRILYQNTFNKLHTWNSFKSNKLSNCFETSPETLFCSILRFGKNTFVRNLAQELDKKYKLEVGEEKCKTIDDHVNKCSLAIVKSLVDLERQYSYLVQIMRSDKNNKQKFLDFDSMRTVAKLISDTNDLNKAADSENLQKLASIETSTKVQSFPESFEKSKQAPAAGNDEPEKPARKLQRIKKPLKIDEVIERENNPFKRFDEDIERKERIRENEEKPKK